MSADVLAAIAQLSEQVRDLRGRIDDLAEVAGRSFDRLEGDLGRIEASANRAEASASAIRADLTALRSEARNAAKHTDARLSALEKAG